MPVKFLNPIACSTSQKNPFPQPTSTMHARSLSSPTISLDIVCAANSSCTWNPIGRIACSARLRNEHRIWFWAYLAEPDEQVFHWILTLRCKLDFVEFPYISLMPVCLRCTDHVHQNVGFWSF